MRTQTAYFLPVIAAFVMTACSHTSFSEYRGADIVQGKGGTVHVVDGIDFWDSGDPDRKYKILGAITDERPNNLIGLLAGNRAIVKAVRERGGDGVIKGPTNRNFNGIDLNNGMARTSLESRLLVVKYLP